MKQIVKTAYLFARTLVLSLLSVFLSKKPGKIDRDISNILFVRIDRIGDMVLSTPAIKALKRAYPRAALTVLTSPANGDVVTHNPHVDRIITYEKQLRLRKKLGLIRQLRRIHFDLAVDPYADYELLPALLAFLSGAAVRIGYAAFGREVFFNLAAPTINDNQHFIDITCGILKPLKIDVQDQKPEIFLSTEEANWAKEWLNRSGLGRKPLVGIHPGAHYESQRWPPEYFANLIDLLHADGETDVLLFGGPGDEAVCKKIERKTAAPVRSHIGGHMRRFVALLASCRVLICNNSGPLHLAVALNVPTVSMMGPTDKTKWMPLGDSHRVFRMDHLPCIGCNLGYCKIKTHDCMRTIVPGMVRAELNQLVG